METIAETQNEQQDLRYYLRIISSYRAPIFWCNLVVLLLASIYTSTATPLYRAKAVLLIEPTKINVSTFAQGMAARVQYREFYETQFQLLLSRSLARKVVDRLKLWQNPELLPVNSLQRAVNRVGISSANANESDVSNSDSSAPLQNNSQTNWPPRPLAAGSRTQRLVLDNFIARLRIKSIAKTKLITIRYDSTDAALAAQVANAIAQQYIEDNLTLRKIYSSDTVESLQIAVTNIGNLVNESQVQLRTFREQNPGIVVQGFVAELDNANLLQSSAGLSEARKQLTRIAGLKRAVDEARRGGSPLVNLSLVRTDPLVQTMQSDLSNRQQKLEILKNRYGERHPLVNDALAEVNSLETTLQLNIDRVANGIITKHTLARQRVAGIERKLRSDRQAVNTEAGSQQQLASLVRNESKLQELYSNLFVKMQQARGAQGIVPSEASITDYAVPPALPFRPRKLIFVVLAVLTTLIFSVLASGIAARLDDQIRSSSDVQKLGLRTLGILPQIKSNFRILGVLRRSRKPLQPAEPNTNDALFTEAVNTIRTALTLGKDSLESKVLLITSSLPGEGKSSAAINLAHSFSRNDERVLLIDCDMRSPAIALAAGFPQHIQGLSSIFENSAALSECIKTGVFDNAFDILPSGPALEQPLELLSSERFSSIIEYLRKHYDRIIIDSAPALAVSDSLILSKQSDSVIYIVKAASTTFARVQRGIERLRQVNAPIAGIAISQVNLAKALSHGEDFDSLGFGGHAMYGDTSKSRSFSQAFNKIKDWLSARKPTVAYAAPRNSRAREVPRRRGHNSPDRTQLRPKLAVAQKSESSANTLASLKLSEKINPNASGLHRVPDVLLELHSRLTDRSCPGT